MSLRDLPLEVVIEFVFPFLTDGELLHLRILSHDFERILQQVVKTFPINENRVSNIVLCYSDRNILYDLLDKLENVEYLMGVRNTLDTKLVYEMIEHLPKLKRVEHCRYLDISLIAKLAPNYEEVVISYLVSEVIPYLNVNRFKIGIVGHISEEFSKVFRQMHYLEEIQWSFEWNSCNFPWEILKEELEFRTRHNQTVLLEKQVDPEIYPETIRFVFSSHLYEAINIPFINGVLFHLRTSSPDVLRSLAPYSEQIYYSGSIRDLLLLPDVDCNVKEIDLSSRNLDWIVTRDSNVTAVVRTEVDLFELEMELNRKVIVQLLHRLKSLQVVHLSLPFNILVLFGNDLNPNMSHYNLEKHVKLDWIPLNFYASVNTKERKPQLILKRRLTAPLYQEPETYENIDFSILETFKNKQEHSIFSGYYQPEPKPATNDSEPGFGLFDDFW